MPAEFKISPEPEEPRKASTWVLLGIVIAFVALGLVWMQYKRNHTKVPWSVFLNFVEPPKSNDPKHTLPPGISLDQVVRGIKECPRFNEPRDGATRDVALLGRIDRVDNGFLVHFGVKWNRPGDTAAQKPEYGGYAGFLVDGDKLTLQMLHLNVDGYYERACICDSCAKLDDTGFLEN